MGTSVSSNPVSIQSQVRGEGANLFATALYLPYQDTQDMVSHQSRTEITQCKRNKKRYVLRCQTHSRSRASTMGLQQLSWVRHHFLNEHHKIPPSEGKRRPVSGCLRHKLGSSNLQCDREQSRVPKVRGQICGLATESEYAVIVESWVV